MEELSSMVVEYLRPAVVLGSSPQTAYMQVFKIPPPPTTPLDPVLAP